MNLPLTSFCNTHRTMDLYRFLNSSIFVMYDIGRHSIKQNAPIVSPFDTFKWHHQKTLKRKGKEKNEKCLYMYKWNFISCLALSSWLLHKSICLSTRTQVCRFICIFFSYIIPLNLIVGIRKPRAGNWEHVFCYLDRWWKAKHHISM